MCERVWFFTATLPTTRPTRLQLLCMFAMQVDKHAASNLLQSAAHKHTLCCFAALRMAALQNSVARFSN